MSRFGAHVNGRARTIYIGGENPANASSFTECYLGTAGEVPVHVPARLFKALNEVCPSGFASTVKTSGFQVVVPFAFHRG
jgi:hypothetical protein